ncbi:unnamed protein product, partial [Didymodactylos carnosus]
PLWLYSKIYPNLESVFITQVEKDGKYLSYLKFFKQLLNLKIYFDEGEFNETVSNELCSNLFQSDCRLQTLFFDNVYVPINTHTIQRCFSIRKLTIKVHCLDDVYVLLYNLPSIESVNISIPYIAPRRRRPEQQNVQLNNEEYISSTLSKLKHFVLYAIFTANYDYLELILSHCCPNLEYLSLNLYIDQFIDGERLEKKLLSKLAKLKVFHFCFRIPAFDNTLNMDDYIQTYKSSYWIDNNYSILCFNQSPPHRHYCVFSLPYMFSKFSYISNDLINYRSNVNNDIFLYSKQSKVKQIALYDTVPYTLELFQIIQRSFSGATELLVLKAPVRCLSDNLLNNEMMLENIVSLIFFLSQLEFQHFRRLLLMTPNILRLYIRGSLVLDVLRNSEDSSFQQLQSICNRIRRVYIDRRSVECDALNDNDIKLLFPNAKLSGWI